MAGREDLAIPLERRVLHGGAGVAETDIVAVGAELVLGVGEKAGEKVDFPGVASGADDLRDRGRDQSGTRVHEEVVVTTNRVADFPQVHHVPAGLAFARGRTVAAGEARHLVDAAARRVFEVIFSRDVEHRRVCRKHLHVDAVHGGNNIGAHRVIGHASTQHPLRDARPVLTEWEDVAQRRHDAFQICGHCLFPPGN